MRRFEPSQQLVIGKGSWGNPEPIYIAEHTLEDVEALRKAVRSELQELEPRLHALDSSLSPETRQRASYVRSKERRDATVNLHLADARTRVRSRTVERRPYHPRSNPPVATSTNLAQHFSRGAVVSVGRLRDSSRETLIGSPRALTVTSGEGEVVPAANRQHRPSPTSFAGWMAMASEHDRMDVAAFVLGSDCGRMDEELLRQRLYPHQIVVAERGSVAAAWLSAIWDGSVAQSSDLLVFSEPGPRFRCPTDNGLPRGFRWPKISVVTVSYNQAEYLEDCLRSVLDQDYPNLEYIVVDAGSSDRTPEILDRWKNRFSTLIVEPDEGQSDGLNKGFAQATGDVLTWINSDDMLAPFSLKRAALTFQSEGCDFVVGTCERFGPKTGDFIHRHHSAFPTFGTRPLELIHPIRFLEIWETGHYFFQPETFFTRDMWLRAGGYLKRHLFWLMDWDFWLRCALTGATVSRIPDLLGCSRVHAAQKTTAEGLFLFQADGILREFESLFEEILQGRQPAAVPKN